ncbi:hypothetical protein FNV43_RR07876 [Rhamnella rubrinervis]|uniref:PGG domain-containing protein n=1 Tax=Rhamnella rubrinervis TaxID=2594499 RepID=A0A8K0HG59_9ROSA|nr:hypothetical protein FNV43_RR07876 [Rhamnella rubrinervis]
MEAAQVSLVRCSQLAQHQANASGETSIFRAADFGMTEMVMSLASQAGRLHGDMQIQRIRDDHIGATQPNPALQLQDELKWFEVLIATVAFIAAYTVGGGGGMTLAFTCLFLAVAATMLAFSATVILIIHMKKRVDSDPRICHGFCSGHRLRFTAITSARGVHGNSEVLAWNEIQYNLYLYSNSCTLKATKQSGMPYIFSNFVAILCLLYVYGTKQYHPGSLREREMGSVARMKKPYHAALKGKWSEVTSFYEKSKELVLSPLTATGDTALHVAVISESGNTDVLKSLLYMLESESKYLPLPFESSESSPFQIKSEYGLTALHVAAATGNLEAAELLLYYDEKLLPLKTDKEETALFLAAAFGQRKMVRFLAPKVHDMRPHVWRKDGTSILQIATLGGHFGTAMELLKLERIPQHMVDKERTPCFRLLANMPSAFKSGYKMGKLKALLYYFLPEVDYADNDKEETNSVPPLTLGENEDCETGHVTEHPQISTQAANSPSVISRVYNAFWRFIAQGSPSIRNMWRDKQKQTQALELAKILAEKDLSWQDLSSGEAYNETISTSRSFEIDDGGEKKENKEGDDSHPQPTAASQTSPRSETPLILAARNGIVEIVEAILWVYPQAIEHVTDKKENIYHVVARYRRTEILDLLQSRDVVVPISRLKRKLNDNDDSILHKAAYMGDFSSRDRPGDALLMQSELQWFKRVQEIVPPYFINHRNKDKMTAHELFTEKHKKLVRDGQEWLTRTTEACTLVAVLIATVAFTCAYTVPGGSNKAGHPLLLKTTAFSVFTTSDVLSLCFSLTSVVIFLSIRTSTMHEQKFKRSLPLKLVLGLTTLFLSVTTMMVAFSATLLLMMRQRLHWAAIPIYTIACCPVTIFLVLQFPLYLDIAWFTVKDLFAG